MPPPPYPGLQPSLDNQSEPVPHTRCSYALAPFHLLLSLWCMNSNISRQQYMSLREILCTLQDTALVQSLPLSYKTLRQACKGQFPILPIQKYKIPVITSKMPTLSAAEKKLAQSTSVWLYYLDPVILVSALVRSPIFMSRVHQGFAQFVDSPSELWHSHAWGSSIHTISGEFARYPSGAPIFPSDFVYYKCIIDSHDRESTCNIPHLGRGVCVGRNFCQSTRPFIRREVVLKIQRVTQHNEASPTLHHLIEDSGPPFTPGEIILHEGHYDWVAEHSIIRHEPEVLLDYTFQNGISASTFQTTINTTPNFKVQRISTYTRQHLTKSYNNKKSISFPFQIFINGFGLHRTVYHSIMGVYMIPAGLSASERAKRHNVFPVTLGPHGSNFPDVIESLSGLTCLDRGVDLGNDSTLFAFALCFLGDMPQQNDNAGFKRPTARQSCCMCLVTQEDRSVLDFDTIRLGRYHHQIRQHQQLALQKNGAAREAFCREYGLSLTPCPLLMTAPSLNLVTFFPSNPCHSEYAGISKIAHALLLEHILTPSACQKYRLLLQRFPFPNRWGRLQSPEKHLEGYKLQEHVRASVIIPLLLRCNMTADWIRPSYSQGIYQIFDPTKYQAVDMITNTLAAVTKSNSIISYRIIQEKDHYTMEATILYTRNGLQHLIQAAIIAEEEIEPALRVRYPGGIQQPQQHQPHEEVSLLHPAKSPRLHQGLSQINDLNTCVVF